MECVRLLRAQNPPGVRLPGGGPACRLRGTPTSSSSGAGTTASYEAPPSNRETTTATATQAEPTIRDTRPADAERLNKKLAELKTIITSNIEICRKLFLTEVDREKARLESALQLNQQLLAETKPLLDAAIASNNTADIKKYNTLVTGYQGGISTLQQKLAGGSPYGMSIAEQERRTEENPQYATAKNIIVQSVKTFMETNSEGTNLRLQGGYSVSAYFASVPPTVKIDGRPFYVNPY